MTNINEIIGKYTEGKATLEATNAALREAKSDLQLDPQKNTLTEAELRATTIGIYPDMANGWGLLDTGTGSLDKVEVRAGKLVTCDCGTMYAMVFIAGRTYKVQGVTLVD